MGGKEIRPVKRPSKSLIKTIERLEADKKGMIAAIETKSGNYFVGKTVMEAVKKARQKYPNEVFYLIRIGYQYVDRIPFVPPSIHSEGTSHAR